MIRLDRAFIQNPHELYRRLRAEGPVARVVIWALFPSGTGGAHTFSVNATMLMTDPPDHTRLRRLVAKAFTSRAVERMPSSYASNLLFIAKDLA
jgi:cytochrome P450